MGFSDGFNGVLMGFSGIVLLEDLLGLDDLMGFDRI
jgi:hypothetical protein